MSPSFRHVALWATVGAVVACSGPQVKAPRGAPRTAAALLRQAMGLPLMSSVQGMTRLEAYVQGKARKADVLLRLQRPDLVQFQALTPTLDLIAVTSTDGRRFVSFERGAARCYTGQPCARNLARMVPVAMEPPQLVDTLLGRPPLLQGRASSLTWVPAKRAYRLVIKQPTSKLTQEVWIDGGSRRFRAAVLRRGDQLLVSIAYGQHDRQGLPHLMRLKVPSDKIDMTLQLREVTVNESIDAQDFRIPCPTGTERVELPCEASRGVTP